MKRKWMLAALALLMTSGAATAKGKEKVCSGLLTDMRTIGVQLGDCDLNSLSSDDFKRVTDVCGEPSTIDDQNETKCRVWSIASVNKVMPANNHGYGARVHIVYKILKVEKK